MNRLKMNKSTRLERNQAISIGLRKLPPKTMIPMNGKLVKASDAAEMFESGIESTKHVAAARAAYLQAVARANAAEVTLRTLIQPIKSFVQHTFGERSHEAAAFGFEPRKPRRVSVEVRCEAVEKLRATRVARGTLGPRQRARIHGHVNAPTATQTEHIETNSVANAASN